MIRFGLATFLFFSGVASAGTGHSESVTADGTGMIVLDVTTDPSDLKWGTEVVQGVVTRVLGTPEGRVSEQVGDPEVPALHRLAVIDDLRDYEMQVTRSDPVLYRDVILRPVAADTVDNGQVAIRSMDPVAYTRQRVGAAGEHASLTRIRIGHVTLAQFMVAPFEYNPAARILTLYRKVRVELRAMGDPAVDRSPPVGVSGRVTPFVQAQLAALAVNYAAISADLQLVSQPRILVITSDELMDSARLLADPARFPRFAFEFVSLGSRKGPLASSAAVKTLIQERFSQGDLDSVLLFGDETNVPLYKWSNSLPGDSWYGFISGNDYYFDVGLGRVPATDAAEAAVFLRKASRYLELQAGGHASRNVMLVAHREQYPGKYTANQESIRNAANPRGLNYVPVYGGAGGYNQTVLTGASSDSYAVIAYRGHGSDTSWSGWARDGASFGRTQVQSLDNQGEKLAVFINVACNNGAIQRSYHSLSEEMLFYSRDAATDHGAVAVIGATIESYTDTNHTFNRNMFEFFQTGTDLRLAAVFGAATNKLVRDNRGSLPTNVKMYMLLGDPMLTPWIE